MLNGGTLEHAQQIGAQQRCVQPNSTIGPRTRFHSMKASGSNS